MKSTIFDGADRPAGDRPESQPTRQTEDQRDRRLAPLAMDADGLLDTLRTYFTGPAMDETLARGRLDTPDSRDYYMALALSIRARLLERWRDTQLAYQEGRCRRTFYLSFEFLMGRLLSNAILNLDIEPAVDAGLRRLGVELEEIREREADAGLGNGGLGRLAACFLDSSATLQLPVRGYGIRYAYGMFRQEIHNGRQVEEPDHWLRDGNPWEIQRPAATRRVQFGGRSEVHRRPDGRMIYTWVDSHDVLAVPYDLPVPGYRNNTVNDLRLWSAMATDEFDFDEFNAGGYTEAVRAKNEAENITMVLYPNDMSENGKELRLRQQYFFVSATLQDVIADWKAAHSGDFERFPEDNCFQLNDTHPAIAVAELMRLLIDHEGLEWDAAWSITSRCMAYTNHTLLPEALESWPVSLMRQLLPRLMDIIFEINARFLGEVADRWPGDNDRLRRMSLIEEGGVQRVRMAYLAVVGSFSVNGVAELHTRLLREGLFRDFNDMWPTRFVNVTNGVTQRRWLAACNPDLRELISEAIGEDWIADLSQISRLRPFADDPAFRHQWQAVHQRNRARLDRHVMQECGILFAPEAMLDVQVKRFHEYKRQLLNVLHVIHLYDRIKRGDSEPWVPRSVLFGGKAAPGYAQAKLIIKLISNVAQVINTDPQTSGLLQVAFFPDYRVSAMEMICPAADLSEQISVAGMEASGTGNMKFMMNGALTIGTLDGANIEILDAVGEDHFFLFGLTAEQARRTRRHYDPDAVILGNPDLSRAMNLLECGHFNRFEPGIFDPLIHSIRNPADPWLVAADFGAYVDAQRRASEKYRDREAWTHSSIVNTASSGYFSTDRTINDYNQSIWKLQPVPPRPLDGGR